MYKKILSGVIAGVFLFLALGSASSPEPTSFRYDAKFVNEELKNYEIIEQMAESLDSDTLMEIVKFTTNRDLEQAKVIEVNPKLNFATIRTSFMEYYLDFEVTMSKSKVMKIKILKVYDKSTEEPKIHVAKSREAAQEAIVQERDKLLKLVVDSIKNRVTDFS